MSRSEYASDTFLAAAGSSMHLLRRAPGGEHRFDGVVVSHAAAVAAARFNRNNKVVAAGCADGRVQLVYSAGGGVMSVLPDVGAGPGAQQLGPITALAWSAGSKRLAAGSADGSITLFDMQRQVGAAAARCLQLRWL
jgi:WD40 repeat protein